MKKLLAITFCLVAACCVITGCDSGGSGGSAPAPQTESAPASSGGGEGNTNEAPKNG